MAEKKNILILHHFPHLGGAENYLVSVLQALNKKHNTFLICQEEGDFTDAAKRVGTAVTIMKLRGWRKIKYIFINYWTVNQIVAFCRKHKIDILASGYYRVTPYAVRAAEKLKIPCVSFIQDIAPTNTLKRFDVFKSTGLVAVSEFVALELRKHSSDVRVVHNAIDGEAFLRVDQRGLSLREELNISSKLKLVGMIAHFVPLKGHEVFLQALRDLTQERSDVMGLIVGTDLYGSSASSLTESELQSSKHNLSSGELQETARKLGVEKYVIFAGERKDIARVFHSLDVFVHPSFKEGFGRVVMEAMASGCAVVATDCGGPRELIEDKVNGFLVRVGDSQMIADRVSILLKDDHKRKTMVQNAREKIQAHFTVEQFEKKILKVFEEVG